ncbi:MAG: SPOR domain-containing protein [Sulfitobacter sp.]|nr:SPOR domain-containing protein [Sulfitobacter sp.]
MKVTRLLAIATIAGSLCVGISNAQIPEQQPAEFPPVTYKGKQYVDSRGCVFIRAGIDGDVAWVPRVTRDRKIVCGFKPSLSAGVAAAPAPAAAAEKPVETARTVPAVTPRPAPVPRAVAPKPRKAAPVVVRQTAPKPAPRRIAPAPAAPAPSTPQIATACPDASPLSQQYLPRVSGLAVRCGPQAAPVLGQPRSGTAVAASAGGVPVKRPGASARPAPVKVSPTTRIVPRHVAQKRVNTRNGSVRVPPGYRRVWEDGRLNPKRAEQTLRGRSDMLLIWTQTVPRRLIDQSTGRDVTASVPLVYPYLDQATQRREFGEVTLVQRQGQQMKRIRRNPGVTQPTYSASTGSARRVVAAPVTAQAVVGKRYVQIGLYGSPDTAQSAARQVASMGMPARIGKYRRGGKTYMSVQAGPFEGSQAMTSAMNRLRRAGYSEAFPRN